MGEIEKYVKDIEIPYLVHFTRTTNIPSIMANGLLSRIELESNKLLSDYNDELRLDGQLASISTSIAFPNSGMLWKLRQKNPGVNWVVLVISKAILWKKNCAFCKYNAADSKITDQDINSLKNLNSLSAMYEPIPEVDRSAEGLKEFDPTDKQAEVLVFDKIEPEYIFGASFQRNSIKNNYSKFFPDRKIVTHGDKGFFSDRKYQRTK